MAQKLIMPFNISQIESGAMNTQYYQRWGYHHRGWDLSGKIRNIEEDVYASGIGKVIACGRDNKFGYVAVIRYYDVYNHKTGKVSDIIARYMHMSKLYISNGQMLNINSRIGVMSGWGVRPTSYAIHLHIEFANNLTSPCYSGQCSSSNIIKAGKTSTMINPNQILHVGPGQLFTKFNGSWCTNEDMSIPKISSTNFDVDIPKETLTENTTINNNYQKLILPVNNSILTEGYSNSYYGHDVETTTNIKTVYASGKGKVITAGKDTILGNVVIIRYDNVFDKQSNKIINVIIRYCHLASITVAKNRTVTKDTKIGTIGKTGNTSKVKLYYEVDTDIKYPQYSPAVKKSGSIIKKGINTTINPSRVLFIKSTAPDKQSMEYDLSVIDRGYVII